jgi:hypothetical protein
MGDLLEDECLYADDDSIPYLDNLTSEEYDELAKHPETMIAVFAFVVRSYIELQDKVEGMEKEIFWRQDKQKAAEKHIINLKKELKICQEK